MTGLKASGKPSSSVGDFFVKKSTSGEHFLVLSGVKLRNLMRIIVAYTISMMVLFLWCGGTLLK